jgi:hypothetical protein
MRTNSGDVITACAEKLYKSVMCEENAENLLNNVMNGNEYYVNRIQVAYDLTLRNVQAKNYRRALRYLLLLKNSLT